MSRKNILQGHWGMTYFNFHHFPGWLIPIFHTPIPEKNETPLFDWGKFFERDRKVILPFSVQIHH